MHAQEFHTHEDPHRHQSRLGEIILGGQDGLVNVLGVILGVAAATHEVRIVLAAGLAATFAESVSMGAVAFTAARAEQALYEGELAREHRHIRAAPELEREEIRSLNRDKGLSGELLEQVVATITANPTVWVAVMMAEELHLAPRGTRSTIRSALTVGIASLVGSLVPLAPFLFLPVRAASWSATASAAVVLFALGAYKAKATIGRWWWSGLELGVIGIASALIGYGIGAIFQTG